MDASILAIRSIASEVAFRVYWPVLITVASVSVAAIVLMVWLITMSPWWWLLAIPVFSAIILAAVAFAVSYLLLKSVRPRQTRAQKKQVGVFVDKIQRLSEITQTPKFILLFRAIRDVISPQKNGLIGSVVGDTTTLTKDYKAIVASFTSTR